jgi:queuine tRNA-ribosyltransferase
MSFYLKKNFTKRRGIISTKHGDIETPTFVFCATKGALKGVCNWQFSCELLLCNAFHLFPHMNVIKKVGIHKFMNWNGPMMCDSGGYQIFSLGYHSVSQDISNANKGVTESWENEIKGSRKKTINRRKITEQGCTFNWNGEKLFLSPEESMKIQHELGVDIVVAFDECTPVHYNEKQTERSMLRSIRWGFRCLNYFKENNIVDQKLYGVVQGGVFPHLRLKSIDHVNKEDYSGVAIGGTLGKTKEEMFNIVDFTLNHLCEEKPRHLLGIGHIGDILRLAPRIDTFDCVEPTRLARHGTLLMPNEKIYIKKAVYANDFSHLSCKCTTCENYSLAYLHHLWKIKDLSVYNALSIHNMHIMNQLMYEIKEGIEQDKYDNVLKRWSFYLPISL